MDHHDEQEIIRVLFVDDEPNVLQAIKRGVFTEHYVKLFALSGQEALDIMSTDEVHVIVSDMRMPGMSGLDLLKTVSERYPETIRIVLSGFNQLTQVFATINTIRVFKYLPKPWDTDKELIPTIQEAIEQYKMAMAYKQFNLVLGKKNDFYQKLLKANDDRMARMKADQDAYLAYFLNFLDTSDEQLLKNLNQGHSELDHHQFSMAKRIVKHALSLQGGDHNQVGVDKLIPEFNQIQTVWSELIGSKRPDATAAVTLNLKILESQKKPLPLSQKQLSGSIRIVLFNLYAASLKTENCFDFSMYYSIDQDKNSGRLDLLLQRPIPEQDEWLERIVDESIRVIVNNECSHVDIVSVPKGKLYAFHFSFN